VAAPRGAGRPSLTEHVSSSGLLLLAIGGAVFAIFLPALVVAYAFSDDYLVLSLADRLAATPWGASVVDGGAANGRPLQGLLTDWFFSAAGAIDNLRFIRLVAVLGIVALTLLLHWALVRSGVRPSVAAPIAVLMCTTPAFQVYGAWAVLFTSPYAALLGAGASMLAVAAADAPESLIGDRSLGAVALLMAGLLVYQPAAMFFWVFLAVALIGAARNWPRARRLIVIHAGVAVAAISLGYLFAKLVVHLTGYLGPTPGRNALTHDPSGKVHWFVHWPLYESLSVFQLTPSAWIAVPAAVVAASGIVLLLRRESVDLLRYGGTALALIPLSFLPNLAVAENSPTYRVLGALASLIALYASIGAIGIWLTLRDALRPRMGNHAWLLRDRLAVGLFAGFVAICAVVASKNVLTLFVLPQSTELRMIRSQVAALPDGVAHVGFVETGNDQGMTRFVSVDEFGVPSTARPWTLQSSVLLILREEGRLAPGLPRPVVDPLPPYETSPPKDEPVIDVRSLRRLR
jgi:hypothetical protein